MASPRPSPCALVVKNGSNRRLRVSGGMPGPVSLNRSKGKEADNLRLFLERQTIPSVPPSVVGARDKTVDTA